MLRGSKLWPVDLLHLGVLFVLLLVCTTGLGEIRGASGWLVFNTAAVISVVGVSRWLMRQSGRRAAVSRLILGCVTVPVVFTQVGFVLAEYRDVEYAGFLFDLDRRIFLGVNPLEALEKISTPWLTEVMQWSYTAYLFLPVATILVVIASADVKGTSRAAWTLVGGIYLSYLGYALVPASGPNIHSNLGPIAPVNIPVLPLYTFTDPLPGLWLAEEMRLAMFHAEPTKRDCFPSGHTAVAFICAVIIGRASRRHGLWAWPLAVMVALSTIYLRYHYVVDVIVGIALAWFAVGPLERLHDRLYREHDSVQSGRS